jgi:hypothetical protein
MDEESEESEKPVEGFANPEEGFANPNNTVFSLKLDNYRNHDIVDPGPGRHVRADAYPSVQAKSLQRGVSFNCTGGRVNPVDIRSPDGTISLIVVEYFCGCAVKLLSNKIVP